LSFGISGRRGCLRGGSREPVTLARRVREGEGGDMNNCNVGGKPGKKRPKARVVPHGGFPISRITGKGSRREGKT